LRSTARIAGVGLHTGASVSVALHPATVDSGVVFISQRIAIPARLESVVDTARATTLGSDGATVRTVEHLLSALAGMGVDNTRIEVDGPELPALDGSAKEWVALIDSAGLETQGAPTRLVVVDDRVHVTDGGARLEAAPADAFAARYEIMYPGTPVGHMTADFEAAADAYAAAIAPARTFGLSEEVEALRAAGLARGGSLDNALVIYPDRYSSPLRLPAEPARHKILDLIGDLSLLGARLQARISVVRGGHRTHLRLAQAIQHQARSRAHTQPRTGVGTHGH